MSSSAVAIVFNHSRSTGTARLVLLALAEHDGENGSWPSVARLAHYASVSPRNVQKALSRLEELGEIQRDIQQGGLADVPAALRTNRYFITLTCPPECDRSVRHRVKKAVDKASEPPLSVATPPVASDARPPVGSDTQTVTRTTYGKEPTYVTNSPVDNSINADRCNWDRWTRSARHYAPKGVRYADGFTCTRCGTTVPPTPRLSEITA